MIRGAHIAHLQNHHDFDGVPLNMLHINRRKMLAQQQQWVEKLRYARYESILHNNPEIELIMGRAEFKNANTLLIKKDNAEKFEIQADRILLAVGA